LKELPKARPWTHEGGRARAIRQTDATPKGIFVCNMCEFFGDWIPTDWQREVFKVIRANPQHRFYFLTKQPWNMARWSPFPDNCWLGATVCDKRTAWNAWWYYFGGAVRAKLKFISFEPLLDDVMEMPPLGRGAIRKADWIIIGSQTKPYNPPKKEWVQAIVEAADEAGVPVFQKDNLKPLLGNSLRQELP
jgi:protein gp37